MRSDALLAVAGLFERALFVGDPGQLDPFAIVGSEQWAGLSYDPSASAVTTLLAHNPELPQHRLPVSWRLPASAAPLVSDAFYPYTPFRSGTGHGRPAARLRGRRRTAPAPTGSSTRRPSRAGACWSCPPGTRPRTDPEAVRAVALVVRRLLDRGGAATSERSAEPVAADRRPDRGRHGPPGPGRRGARGAGGAGRHGCDRGHGEPAPGPGVRRHGGPAPAVRAARTRRRSTWRRAACASWPPGTGTRASWCAGRASPTCWTTTRRRSRSSWG